MSTPACDGSQLNPIADGIKAIEEVKALQCVVQLVLNGKWVQAQRVAFAITTKDIQAIALHVIVESLARDGQKTEAITLVWRIKDSAVRDRALTVASKELAYRKQWKDAVDLVHVVKDVKIRNQAWETLAEKRAYKGEWMAAIALARNIRDKDYRDSVLSHVAYQLATTPKWQRVIDVTRKIQDTKKRERALRRVVASLTRKGKWQEGLEITDVIQDEACKADARTLVAQALAKGGQVAKALEIIRSVTDVSMTGHVFHLLLGELTKQKKITETLDWISSIQDEAMKAGTLHEFAKQLEMNGQKEAAHEVLTFIPMHLRQIWVHYDQAIESAKRGQSGEAFHIISLIEDPNIKAEVAGTVFRDLTELGQWSEVAAAIRICTNARVRRMALMHICEWFAEHEPRIDAVHIAGVIVELVRSDHEYDLAESSLHDIVEGLTKSKQWAEAASIAASIQSDFYRGLALSHVAGALAEDGQGVQALEFARSLPNHGDRVEALLALAWELPVNLEGT